MESYSTNLVDFYMIRDLIPSISKLYFHKVLDDSCRLSKGQAFLLAGLGLQGREIEDVCKELDIEVSQGLALFSKSVKRIAKQVRISYEKEHRSALSHVIE